MTISETVSSLVSLLDQYARGGLRDRNMLATILQLAGEAGKPEIIGELAFHGKYLSRLHRTLGRGDIEPDAREKLQGEFVAGVAQFQNILAPLLPEAGEETRDSLDRHFFALAPHTIPHLLALAEDFAQLKNWEREMEEGGMDGDETSP